MSVIECSSQSSQFVGQYTVRAYRLRSCLQLFADHERNVFSVKALRLFDRSVCQRTALGSIWTLIVRALEWLVVK